MGVRREIRFVVVVNDMDIDVPNSWETMESIFDVCEAILRYRVSVSCLILCLIPSAFQLWGAP